LVGLSAGLAVVLVGLGAGLAVGAVTEAAKRGLGLAGLTDASRLYLFSKVFSFNHGKMDT